MADNNGTTMTKQQSYLDMVGSNADTQILKELARQQADMKKLLEEMHERQAGIVEEAVRRAFAKQAAPAGSPGTVAPSVGGIMHDPAALTEVPDAPLPPETAGADDDDLEHVRGRQSWITDGAASANSGKPSDKKTAKKEKKMLFNATKIATASSHELGLVEESICAKADEIIHSAEFDYVVGFVILMNSLFIAIQTDVVARNLEEPTDPAFRAFDLCFTIFFSLELLLRLVVERVRFLAPRNRGWNIFDSIVVLTAIFEELAGLSSNTRVLRLLRVMRLVRLARFIRVMRVFRELHAMVWGIMHSIMSLIWAIILLVIFMFLFACYITQSVSYELMEPSPDSKLDEEDIEVLRSAYGSLVMTMYSLYQAITGGQDWSYFADPLFKISTLLGVLFCFYIAFAVLAILNVVTGVFVDNAMKSTELDTDLMIVEESAGRQKASEALRAVFHGADQDKSGTIDWDEFKRHLSTPAVQAYFRQLGLDIEGPGVQGLWELLDFDRNGTLNIDEMVYGAARLKGHASSLDLARESYTQRVTLDHLMKLVHEVKKSQLQQTAALRNILGAKSARQLGVAGAVSGLAIGAGSPSGAGSSSESAPPVPPEAKKADDPEPPGAQKSGTESSPRDQSKDANPSLPGTVETNSSLK